MIFDKLNCNAFCEDFGTCPDVIDLGADFANAIFPSANYAVGLEEPATADVTVTVTCGDSEDGTGTDLVTVTVPAGLRVGFAVLPTIPKRYVAATATGGGSGKFSCGIVWGVASPSGVGLNA